MKPSKPYTSARPPNFTAESPSVMLEAVAFEVGVAGWVGDVADTALGCVGVDEVELGLDDDEADDDDEDDDEEDDDGEGSDADALRMRPPRVFAATGVLLAGVTEGTAKGTKYFQYGD